MKIGVITKEQQYIAMRKASREMELEKNSGWPAKEKVHQSEKSYSRKSKHKKRY